MAHRILLIEDEPGLVMTLADRLRADQAVIGAQRHARVLRDLETRFELVGAYDPRPDAPTPEGVARQAAAIVSQRDRTDPPWLHGYYRHLRQKAKGAFAAQAAQGFAVRCLH